MARYQEIEAQTQEQIKSQQVAANRYALERKYNKAKPIQLFEYILQNLKDSPHRYLFPSNNKDNWKKIKEIIEEHKSNDIIIHIIRTILKNGDSFIYDKENILALNGIFDIYSERIRDIDDWKPKRNNTSTILRDLLNHLFTNYPVPYFLVNGFIRCDLSAMLLYVHIGTGKSLKKFELYPDMILTNKCFHHIQTTPNDSTFNEAFRRAQIIHLGGDDRLFNLLMRTRLHTITNSNTKENKEIKKEKEEFWVTIIKFFIEHPMINSDKVPEIIDYIYDQKYTLKRINRVDGTFVNRPEQPNFNMKGRTPMSLINQSDEWHRMASVNTKRQKDAKEWEPIPIKDFIYEKGESIYTIIQLTKTAELIQEGNRMHNCVATYASSCLRKMCAIFSFRHTNMKQFVIDAPHITIEVRGKSIVQIRGRYNKKPEPYYMSMVEQWAYTNNLSISKYAL